MQFNGIHKVAESDKIERLVLEEDPETGEAIVEVDDEIVKKLKPHQAEGIRFMYNACYESVEMIKQNKVPGGCILAHCMGLGKTLQVISFSFQLLSTDSLLNVTHVIIRVTEHYVSPHGAEQQSMPDEDRFNHLPTKHCQQLVC